MSLQGTFSVHVLLVGETRTPDRIKIRNNMNSNFNNPGFEPVISCCWALYSYNRKLGNCKHFAEAEIQGCRDDDRGSGGINCAHNEKTLERSATTV